MKYFVACCEGNGLTKMFLNRIPAQWHLRHLLIKQFYTEMDTDFSTFKMLKMVKKDLLQPQDPKVSWVSSLSEASRAFGKQYSLDQSYQQESIINNQSYSVFIRLYTPMMLPASHRVLAVRNMRLGSNTPILTIRSKSKDVTFNMEHIPAL